MNTASEPLPGTRIPSRRATRREPLVGVLFVVLFLVGVFCTSTPDDSASDAKWTNYFDKTGHQVAFVISAFALALAALCLIWYFTMFWTRLGDHTSGSPLMLLTAGMSATCIGVGGSLYAGIAGAMLFGSLPVPSADVLRAFDDVAYPIIVVAGMLALALTMAIASIKARATGLFGKRMLIFSLVMAVITVASVAFFPLAAMIIWFIVTSIVLLRRPVQPAGG